ncbi:MAG: FkbM family methyltransferase [Okeania sp. SIO2H7]|nr:FkbM family methyltransferase [Okeania sp. SIO2H7]
MADLTQEFQKAINFQKQGKFKEAESIYIKILKSDGGNVGALVNLGLLEQQRGKLEEAFQFYKYAFSKQPKNFHVLYLLAKLSQELSLLDEAVSYWQRLLEIKPGSAVEYYGNIGNCLVQQGKFEDALGYFKKALQVSPKSHQAHQAIGNLFVRQNKLAEAKEEFAKAIKINPNYTIAKIWFTLVDKLLKGENKIAFTHRGVPVQFELTGKNLAVEVANAAGSFYELPELEFIYENLPDKNITVLDVGANVGNHLVYFSKIMNVVKVIPTEFHPVVIENLKKHIAINQVNNVDFSKLGYAIGKSRGKAVIEEHPAKDWCLTEVSTIDSSLAIAAPIEIVPLDELITEKVGFIKVDVQGSEMDALEGGRNLFFTSKPHGLIEVTKAHVKDFLKFIESIDYQTIKAFDHGRYVNFYIQPIR